MESANAAPPTLFSWLLGELIAFFFRSLFIRAAPNQAGTGEGCTGGFPPTEGMSMAKWGADSGACL